VGGKAIPIVGTGVSIASAGWDQWREDADNPNLTTTDRVGRAAGVGTYVGGAAAAGAIIGTAILPVGGTAAGLVVGAAAGLAVGAVASSIEPVKQAFADAGQWTANAAVDSYHYVDDKLQQAEAMVDTAENWVGDKVDDIVPDVDLPDLNPF
jgi:hypothetical protein